MYSPQIKDEQVKKIYIMSLGLKKPMTKIVEMAVDDFVRKFERQNKKKK